MDQLSDEDKALLTEFLAWSQENMGLMEGYNRDVPLEGFVLVGCITLLCYDYVCTFTREVTYVWTSAWSIGLPLFYINRYVPMLDIALFVYSGTNHMTITRCNYMLKTAIWLITVASFFAQLIIVLRTCALWGNRRLVVWPLLFLMVATLAITSLLTGMQTSDMSFAPTPSFIPGCLVGGKYNDSIYVYVTLFVVEAVIVGLTIAKAVQHLRRRSRSSWLSQLYKNGIFFCICILLFTLMNIAVHLSSMSYVYKQVMRLPQHVFHSIFCNRVMLQILQYRHHLQEGAVLRERRRAGARWRSNADGPCGCGTADHHESNGDILTTVYMGTKSSAFAAGEGDIAMSDPDLASSFAVDRHLRSEQWVD